jgi:phage-related protein
MATNAIKISVFANSKDAVRELSKATKSAAALHRKAKADGVKKLARDAAAATRATERLHRAAQADGLRRMARDQAAASRNAKKLEADLQAAARAAEKLDRKMKLDGAKRMEKDLKKVSDAMRGVTRSADGMAKSLARSITSAGGKALGYSLMGFIALGVASGTAQVASALTAGLLATLPALGVLPAFALAAASAFGVLKVATSGVADALSLGLTAAATGLPADLKAYEKAMGRLSPAARALVRQLESLRPALLDIRNAVAQKMFAGLAREIKGLAGVYLPLLSKHGQTVAASMNHAARQVSGFLRQGSTAKSVGTIFGFIEKAIDNAASAIRPLVKGLLPLFTVSASFLPGMTSGLREAATRFAAFMKAAEKSGKLKAFIQGGIDALKALMGILGSVGGILKSVFVDANQGAGGFFAVIGTVLKRVDAFLNSAAGMKAVSAVWQVLGVIGKALGDALAVILPQLGKALVTLAPHIGPLAIALGKFLEALAPILPVAGKLAGVFADQLAKALPILAPALLVVGKAIAALLTAVAPLLPIIAQVAAVIGTALAAAVTKLAPFIGPLVTALGAGLLTVVKALAPLLPIIATVMGKLLAAVTPLIAPIAALAAKFITGLMPAIVSLMPTIDRLLAALGPHMTAILDALAPTVPRLAEAFSAMAPAIIQILEALIPLVPVATKFATMVIRFLVPTMVTSAKGIKFMAGQLYVLAAALRFIPGVLRFVSSGFGGFFGNVVTMASRFATWMVSVPRRIVDGFVNGLRSGWHRVTDFFADAINAIPLVIRKALGISSPSKVMAGIGVNIGKGLIGGIKSQIPAIRTAVGSMAAVVAGGVPTDTTMKLRADAVVTGSGAATVPAAPITINVSVANGVDPAEVGRRTIAAIEAWQKRSGRQRLIAV